MKIPTALAFGSAFALLLPSTPPATAAAEGPVAAAEEKRLAVKFERYGGFAGFHDNISIFADFRYEMETPGGKEVFKGSLTEDHKKQLTDLLARYGEWIVAASDGPGIADGMETRLEIHGSGEIGKGGDLAPLYRLLHEILTAAKTGEKSPKATR